MNTNTFQTVTHPLVKPNTLSISMEGNVNDSRGIHRPSYLSTNGYLYEFINTNDGRLILYPFDILMASTFIPVPKELVGVPIKVNHKNGLHADCSLDNLEWIEDVEEWRDIEYADIKRRAYQVSNHGRIRSLLDENKPKLMKIHLERTYYQSLTLKVTGFGNKKFSVHRIVAYAFVEGFDLNLQVNHIDGDKSNNMAYNLEWVSGDDNIRHAYMTGLSKYDLRVLSKDDAKLICITLNKNNGSIMSTYNELCSIIPNLTYPMVSSIKYGNTFTDIGEMFLTDKGRNKQIRQTDPDVIIEVSVCLKENNGDVKKTRDKMISKYPWISLGWIWHLKDKSVGSEVTDLVFSKDEFPKCIPLTEPDVLKIVDCLLAHKGDPHISRVVYDELKDEIEGLSFDKVRTVREKKAWTSLTDKYFLKGEV